MNNAPPTGMSPLSEAAGLDVAELPSFGFSHRALTWWGTMGMIAIEGTVFAIALVAYFYLRANAPQWPLNSPPPDLLWGTLNTFILLASLVPNHWMKKSSEDGDLRRLRRAFLVCLVFSAAFLLVRVFEFTSLNVRWDADAYGSAVWMLLGLHTLHLVTDAYDTLVLAVLLYTGPLEERRRVDASENAMYWNFVVASWLPIYAVIYWAPRVH
jgi:cytochrome c oxidase subunit I+III